MPIKIDASGVIQALTFTADGEYLVGGHDKEVRMWRVEDKKQVARIATPNYVNSVTASKNGKWIAAGTYKELFVWDAQMYKPFFKHEEGNFVNAVDFLPDSISKFTKVLFGLIQCLFHLCHSQHAALCS